MWQLDHKEGWASNWCFQTVVLEKTLECPLDSKEIKPGNPKRNQPWPLTGRTDAEAEAPILCPHDAQNWLIWKDPDAGKYWGQEEKGITEDEMVRWHHRFSEHEFRQALGDGEGQGSLTCYSLRSHKELDMTERLNWTDVGIFQPNSPAGTHSGASAHKPLTGSDFPLSSSATTPTPTLATPHFK